MKILVITIIVLDNVLKVRIELITLRNDNAMQKFYRVQVVSKSWSLGRNFENFRKNDNSIKGDAPALRVIRAGTRLTVHRSLPWKYSRTSPSDSRVCRGNEQTLLWSVRRVGPWPFPSVSRPRGGWGHSPFPNSLTSEWVVRVNWQRRLRPC